jgi:hypothetical protein
VRKTCRTESIVCFFSMVMHVGRRRSCVVPEVEIRGAVYRMQRQHRA